VGKIHRLVQSFGGYIAIPWRNDTAAAQRVIFCVYDEKEELRLQANIDEFEIVTRRAGHEWAVFDFTNSFANWLLSQRYAASYFAKPHLLPTLLPKFRDYLAEQFDAFLRERNADDDFVIALKGIGSLFGFLKVKEVVDVLAPMVKGRLVVFFPGSYENNNYRLLDGYDGWDYLAVLITADREF
jgi:hypothetical protein